MMGIGAARGPGTGGLHQDSINWRSRIRDAGGEIDEATLKAVDEAADGLRELGLSDATARFNPFAGSNLYAAMIPYWKAEGPAYDVNQGFTDEQYSRYGLTGDGNYSYIDTGIQPARSSYGGFGAFAITESAGESYLGVIDGKEYYTIGETFNAFGGIADGGILDPTHGWVSIQRDGDSDVRLFRNGVQVQETNTTKTPFVLPRGNAYVFAYNQDGQAKSFTNVCLAGYLIWRGVVGQSFLNDTMQKLMKKLGRIP